VDSATRLFSPEFLFTVLGTVVGIIVWLVRGEGAQRRLAADLLRLETDMTRFYATKEEVAQLQGEVKAVSATTTRSERALDRIESKVDAFLVAAVRDRAGHAVTTE
jgi:hypothetical protein